MELSVHFSQLSVHFFQLSVHFSSSVERTLLLDTHLILAPAVQSKYVLREPVRLIGGRMEQPTQRDSVFPQVWSLYQACRRSGIWAKLVLENGVDGETFSFTSKRHPVPVHFAAAVNPPRPQSTRSNKRKSPSNLKKDRVKWRAWLERKLKETEQSCGEETGPQFERPPPISTPSFASVTRVSGSQTQQLPTLELPADTQPVPYTSPLRRAARRDSTGARRTTSPTLPPVAPSLRYCNLYQPELRRREGLASDLMPPTPMLCSWNPALIAARQVDPVASQTDPKEGDRPHQYRRRLQTYRVSH